MAGSQDGRNGSVAAVVKQWKKRLMRRARAFDHWQRPRTPAPGQSDKQARLGPADGMLPRQTGSCVVYGCECTDS